MQDSNSANHPRDAFEDSSFDNTPAEHEDTLGTADAETIDEPLDAAEFLEDEIEPTETVTDTGPPGMFILEAFWWTGSTLAIHVFGGLTAMLLLTSYVANRDAPLLENSPAENPNFPYQVETVQSLFVGHVLTFEMLLFVLFAIAVTSLRTRTKLLPSLNFSPIRPLHFCCLVLMLLPMIQVSGAFYTVGDQVWQSMTRDLDLAALDELNTVTALPSLMARLNLPMLLLLVAVAPAIGEELIFRGLIGRGLVARYGIWIGVLVSSVLFAGIHGHPVHAFSVFPLGVCMHLAYLATRSFWAPVMVHFLNNGLAVVAGKFIQEQGVPDEAAVPSVSLSVFTVAAISVSMLLTVLWKSRVRHFYPDGTEWNPGYESTGPIAADATPYCEPVPGEALFAALASFVGFLVIMTLAAA